MTSVNHLDEAASIAEKAAADNQQGALRDTVSRKQFVEEDLRKVHLKGWGMKILKLEA